MSSDTGTVVSVGQDETADLIMGQHDVHVVINTPHDGVLRVIFTSEDLINMAMKRAGRYLAYGK